MRYNKCIYLFFIVFFSFSASGGQWIAWGGRTAYHSGVANSAVDGSERFTISGMASAKAECHDGDNGCRFTLNASMSPSYGYWSNLSCRNGAECNKNHNKCTHSTTSVTVQHDKGGRGSKGGIECGATYNPPVTGVPEHLYLPRICVSISGSGAPSQTCTGQVEMTNVTRPPVCKASWKASAYTVDLPSVTLSEKWGASDTGPSGYPKSLTLGIALTDCGALPTADISDLFYYSASSPMASTSGNKDVFLSNTAASPLGFQLTDHKGIISNDVNAMREIEVSSTTDASIPVDFDYFKLQSSPSNFIGAFDAKIIFKLNSK